MDSEDLQEQQEEFDRQKKLWRKSGGMERIASKEEVEAVIESNRPRDIVDLIRRRHPHLSVEEVIEDLNDFGF